MQEGGPTNPLPQASGDNPAPDMSPLVMEQIMLLREISSKLDTLAVKLEDDDVVYLIKRYGQLNDSAGGALQ